MKALSLYQPWAAAIELGQKRIETRSWATRHRGPLLIHAARTKVGLEAIRANPILWAAVLGAVDHSAAVAAFEALPFGALVARCELFDCVAAGDTESIRFAARRTGEKYSPHERALGDYRRGRWAWMLRNIEPLQEPIPCAARQGLFEIDFAAIERMEARVRTAAAEIAEPGNQHSRDGVA